MARLLVSVLATHQHDKPEHSLLLSDFEDEVASDQDPMNDEHDCQTKELMGAAHSKKGTDCEVTDQSKHLALHRTTSSPSNLRKKNTFTEPALQSPGIGKRQTVSDTSVSPSKRTLPERGRNTVGHGHKRQSTGQLRRPRRALSNKSTNKQIMVPARNDVYAVGSRSPVEDKPTPTAKTAHQSQSGVISTRSGNHNLRSTGRIIGSKPKDQSRKSVSTKPAPPAMSKPIREDESQIAARSADDEPDSVNGNPVGSEGGQEASSDAGPQLGSNQNEAQFEEHGDNDGSKDENVDERGEAVDSEAEDNIATMEVDREHQVRSTTQFLLRGLEWDKVIEGADTVGDSQVNNVMTKGKPKLETRPIKAFVKQVRIVSKIYKVSGEKGRVVSEVQELKGQVEAINEAGAGNRKREMIQDIYAHAIPELVFMLDNAISAREADCSDPEHTEGLEEIIQLQSIVIGLCEKARKWKEEPITDRPIKRSTQRILRYLRSIRKAFYAELQNRERGIASKKDEAAGKLDRGRREEEMRQQEMDAEEERLANWDKIKEQLDQNEQSLFRRRPSRPPSAVPPSSIDDWTFEQELVLNKGLEDFGHLPGEC